jgi:hypothetical protein
LRNSSYEWILIHQNEAKTIPLRLHHHKKASATEAIPPANNLKKKKRYERLQKKYRPARQGGIDIRKPVTGSYGG